MTHEEAQDVVNELYTYDFDDAEIRVARTGGYITDYYVYVARDKEMSMQDFWDADRAANEYGFHMHARACYAVPYGACIQLTIEEEE